MAGPFDRFCGFCGHELLQGARRSPLWRLWLLVALIPLGGTLAFGMSPLSRPTAASVAQLVARLPLEQDRTNESVMGFKYSYPAAWTAYDYSEAKPPEHAAPFVVVAHLQTDTAAAASANGNLLAIQPADAVVVLGRMRVPAGPVDQSDPVAMLSYEIGKLTSVPPKGVSIAVVRPVRSITVDGKQGAEAVFELTRGNQATYVEQAYIADPGSTKVGGAVPLFTVLGAAPSSVWQNGAATSVEELIQSLKFTS